jgi:ubiquinone/menaquinone biosynthesis C-methylase UbiE
VNDPPPEVIGYYSVYAEELRLTSGSAQLEFERTKELLTRVLPAPPAQIADVGGASGAYAFWLAGLGYAVHLIDATPRLVEEARRRNAESHTPLASIARGDARHLPSESESMDVVLIMGPLYHLTAHQDRVHALGEADRVLRRGGLLAAAGISRYAGALDGIAFHPSLDPSLAGARHRALVDGQYRNPTNDPRYFVTAYFHRPEELQQEIAGAGFQNVHVYGVEGPGWLLTDFDTRWSDPRQRQDVLTVARLLEGEPSIVGMSAHLLATGRKREE